MVMQRDFYILAALSAVLIVLVFALTKFKFKRALFVAAGIALVGSYILYMGLLSGVV